MRTSTLNLCFTWRNVERTSDKSISRLTYLTRTGTPKIHATAETHGKNILRWPINKIEIEIVLQLRRVEHFEGNSWDLSCCLSRWPQQLLTFDSDGWEWVWAGIVVVLWREECGILLEFWCVCKIKCFRNSISQIAIKRNKVSRVSYFAYRCKVQLKPVSNRNRWWCIPQTSSWLLRNRE